MVHQEVSLFKLRIPLVVELGALCIILLFATGLRVSHIGEWSFWIDELFTLENGLAFRNNLTHNFNFALREHFVTSALVGLGSRLWGVGEFSARIFVALAGVLSIPILYRYVKYYYGVVVGLLFSLFLAVAPWHVYWSQNARFYTVLLLLYWWGMFLLLRWFDEENGRLLFGSFVLILIATSERLLALFAFPVFVLFFIIYSLFVKRRKINLTMLGAGIILLLVALALFAGNFIQNPALWLEIYVENGAIDPALLIVRYVQSVDLHIILLASVGVFFLYKRKDKNLYFWLSAIAVPVVIVFLLSFVQFVHPRYLFITLVGWLIVAAVGCGEIVYGLVSTNNYGVKITAVILLTLLLPISELKEYYGGHGGRSDWRGAYQYVMANSTNDAEIFTNDTVVANYYLPNDYEIISMRQASEKTDALLNCQLSQEAWFVVEGEGRMLFEIKEWVQQNSGIRFADSKSLKVYWLAPHYCD